MTPRHDPPAIDRTGYAALRRVTGEEGIHADTVRVGPSVPRNAEGARLPTGPLFLLGGSPPVRGSYARRKAATAVPHDTSVRPERTTDTPTSVYRYYDGDGRLIYVGVTSRGPMRQAQHAVTAEWWPHARAQDVEHYPDRPTALRREKWLIERHRPPFNRQHNPEHEERKAGYLELVTPVAERCGHCEGCQMDAGPDPDRDEAADEYGCRWEIADDPTEPDEERFLCPVCRSVRCVYADGHYLGGMDGWRTGYQRGTERAWREAHERYRAVFMADLALRSVVDGHYESGYVSIVNVPAERSMREIEACIGGAGVDALVEQAKAKVPF